MASHSAQSASPTASQGGEIVAGRGIEAVASAYTAHQNVKMAREHRRFLAGQSSTADSRRMKDLKRAGLNPLLVGQYGGAQTPVSAAPQITNPLEGTGDTASAYTTYRLQERIANAQIRKTNSETTGQSIKNVKDAKYTPVHEKVGVIVNEAVKDATSAYKTAIGRSKSRKATTKYDKLKHKGTKKAFKALKAKLKSGKITRKQYNKAHKQILEISK